MRDTVIVMVGGAPVTQEYADAVGADGYAADASATVKKAKALLTRSAQGSRMMRPAADETVLRSATREVVIGHGQPLLPDRRADQPDRPPDLPGAAPGRRPVGDRARRQGPGRGRRRRARRQHGRAADRRGRAAGQGNHDGAGAHRPADLHRLLGRRGARGRPPATRAGRWSTRSPPRTTGWSDPPAGQEVRRRDHRAAQRPRRDPDGGREADRLDRRRSSRRDRPSTASPRPTS